jgi:hypothetical protein
VAEKYLEVTATRYCVDVMCSLSVLSAIIEAHYAAGNDKTSLMKYVAVVQ